MATIVTRSGKGSPLTNNEVDANFNNLNTDKLELSGGTLTGSLTVPSLSVDNITIDGNEIDLSSGDLTLDVAGKINLDHGSPEILLKDGGAHYASFISSNTDFVIQSIVSDKDMLFKGQDGSSTITALTLDMSNSGSASFSNNVNIPNGGLMVGATTAPDNSLHVNSGTTNIVAKFESTDAGAGIRFADNSGTATIETVGADFNISSDPTGVVNNSTINFQVDGLTKATINNSGVLTCDGGVVVDNITIDGTTIALSSGDLTLDVAGNINLDADGGGIALKDGGTQYGLIFKNSNDLEIYSHVQDGDIKLRGNDGGSGIVALTLDMSAAGAATFNSSVSASGISQFADVNIPDNNAIRFGNGQDLQIYHDGNNSHIDNNTGNLTLDVAGTITLDADNTGTIYLKDGGTTYGQFFQDSNRFFIQSTVSDADMLFRGSDAGNVFTALTLDMSDAGAATFNSSVTAIDLNLTSASPVIRFTETDQSNKNYLIGSFGSAFAIYDNTASQYRYIIDTNGNHIFNEGSVDVDFRVESNGNANMLFVDGGNNRVGVAESSPSSPLHVSGSTTAGVLTLGSTAASALTISTTGANTWEFNNAGNNSVYNGYSHTFKNGSTSTGLVINNQGVATFGSTVTVPTNLFVGTSIVHQGDSNTSIDFQPDVMDLYSGGSLGVRVQPTAVTINEAGADLDFRIESDANTHMLFVDGGNNRVGVGVSNPSATAHIQYTTQATGNQEYGLVINGNDTGTNGESASIFLGSVNNTVRGASIASERQSASNNHDLIFSTSGPSAAPTERFRIASDGAATFNSTIAATSATFTTADNLPQLTLISTDADANAGPLLVLDRQSASPADGDSIGTISFNGKNDAAEAHGYAKIEARIVDASNATEDGRLELMTSVATEEGISRILMNATETVINDNSKNLDFRVESDNNANALFVDGATGNVMVGGNDSGNAGTINLAVGIVGSTTGGLQLWSGTSGNHYVQFGDTNSSNGPYRGAIGYRHGDDAIVIFTAGSEKFRIASDGAATFNGDVSVPNINVADDIRHTGDSDTYISFETNNQTFYAGGTRLLDLTSGNITFNEGGGDVDFRVESSGNANMLFVNGGTNNVGINSTATNARLEVVSTSGEVFRADASGGAYRVVVNQTGVNMNGLVGVGTTNPVAPFAVGGAGRRIEVDGASGVIRGFDRSASWAALDFEASAYTFDVSTARMMDISSSGVIINEDSADADFRVESNNNTHMIRVDGGNDRVGIGEPTPTKTLSVLGDAIIKNTTDGTYLTLHSTQANNASGPDIILFRDSTSPADDDALSTIFYQGKNSAGSTKDYMKVRSYILDVTDGTEDFGMDIQIMTGGNAVNALDILPTEMVINNASVDRDFRVESDGNDHMLFVDGGNNRVGIGRSGPQSIFEVHMATNKNIGFSDQQSELGNVPAMVAYHDSGALNDIGLRGSSVAFATASQSRMEIHENLVVINEGGFDADFRVESNSYSHMLFVDAGNNGIGIANSSVEYQLDVGADGIAHAGGKTMRINSSGDTIFSLSRAGTSLFSMRNNATSYTALCSNNSADLILGYSTSDAGAIVDHLRFRATSTVFNEDGADRDFRVEGDSNTHALFVEASSNIVNFGRGSSNVNSNGGYILGGECIMSTGSTANTYLVRNTSSASYSFYVSGAGQIHAVQTSISSLSDKRLKENIVDIDTGLAEVMALKPRKFDWREGEGSNEKNVTGFVAQEVETVLPNLISSFKHDDLDDAKSVKMGDIVPTLVKAMQEQQTLIETLTARITALENA